MNRDRAYYRYQRNQHIQRKIHILKGYGDWWAEGWMQGQPGRLAKGKIHCSCPMCREKSYDDWSMSDKRKILSGKQQVEDLGEGDLNEEKRTSRTEKEDRSKNDAAC